MSSDAAAEKQFYSKAKVLFEELLRDSPTSATFLGDHRYDDRLGDYSPAAIADQRLRLGQWLGTFQDYPAANWTLDAQIDRILTIGILKQFIRGFDLLRKLQRDPSSGPNECLSGVDGLIMREFAPLPERMKGILGRLRETPRVLAESRALIIPAEVPLVWAEVAIESARQGVGLFAAFVPILTESVPDLKESVLMAAHSAAGALEEYIDWMRQEVLPQAQGDFAMGQELFNELLREDHMVEYETDALLVTGWRLYEDTRRQMKELAGRIDPDKTVEELLEESKWNHPTAEGLLDAYRQSMDAARQFVIEHEIASIPPGECVRIIPTPPFLRPIIPYAAYSEPGFLEKVQEGVFVVTPVEEGADPGATERKLRGHPWADIPVTALHEAYPGHHLQLVVANRTGSLPRLFGGFLSSLFIEGWAFYCEELMEELGFIDQPIQKLARLQAQLWRASRIILDVSLHTGKMTVEEAIAFLVERANLELDDARAEVLRYTAEPTQPQCYLMGKLQLLDIVAQYQARYPDATMRQMHDAILQCGSLPPRLMRMQLFGESSPHLEIEPD